MKRILFPLVAVLFFSSCQKEPKSFTNAANANVFDDVTAATTSNKLSKISICHRTKPNTNAWITIEINKNALAAHLAHGDVVPDEDGDGFTKANPCGTGLQNDCDDLKPGITPAAEEICNNGKDENCNGQIDENCGAASVAICNQVWMVKNLDVTKYRNGDDIPYVADNAAWASLTTGAWCFFNFNAPTGTTFGKLYNWYAVNDPRGLAPAGWHVPSGAEWNGLRTCLGGEAIAGGKMKEQGLANWLEPNTGATNSSGFTALPGGARDAEGTLLDMYFRGYWWSTNGYSPEYAESWILSYNLASLRTAGSFKTVGFSVRCIKD